MIPYSTDAPIYHFPYATIGLIVANVLAFIALPGPSGVPEMEAIDAAVAIEPFVLSHDRIAPWQWLTCNFLHMDHVHLIGNMVFLWAFGLVVEGKIGWWRFLIVYLLIGIVHGAVIQIGMVLTGHTEGGSLGASAAIFGLIGMAVVWAPKNEFSCFMWAFRPRLFEISILAFGAIYLGLQLLGLVLSRFSMSSELLHVSGLAIGFPLGLWMLKREWVDCEGWDLLSVYRGQTGRAQVTKNELISRAKEDVVKQSGQQRVRVLQSVRDAIAAGQLVAATNLYTKHANLFNATDPFPDELLLEMVKGLHHQQQWDESVPLMQQLIAQSKLPLVSVRLKLAEILLRISKRPSRALRVLDAVPPDRSAAQESQVRKLTAMAERALAQGDGDLELSDD